MIHLLVGNQILFFFSDWSTNNTPETLRSYWLSYFNKTSGQKSVRRKQMADTERGFSENEFSTALAEALRYFKYDTLKVEQIECLRRVIGLREDVLTVLPTGFGKSLIYQIIPKVLECLKNEGDDTQKVIVCVVSSLEYIRKQQVASINKLKGLSAAAVGDNEETDKDIEELKMEVRTSYLQCRTVAQR